MCVMCIIAAFDQGIQVSYSKENETVTLAFPEELKVILLVWFVVVILIDIIKATHFFQL